MYLKQIEIEGFKSFADRTVVPVQQGLTGIVGPNGCGKSNVVDALLWVLGERSMKALRADAAEDVIFEGAEGRPAASYAMVEIILVDEENLLEAGGEVAVGRRLFRSGESDYLLNGRKVRRKDVRDLLMNSGLGVRGYMVLAQGKIDAVLAANPKDRRSVLEEAAGISRYKARKHETLLKIDQTALNLSRVDDVLGEVQRAVRSLRYQAGKARRFVELRDRYRDLRVQVALGEEHRLREEERELRRREAEVSTRLETVRSEREQADERLQTLEKEEAALRERHDTLRAEAGAAKEKAAGLEERVRGLEARASEMEQRSVRESERLEQLELQGRERSTLAAGLAEELAALAAERDAASTEREAAESAFTAARTAHQELKQRMETLRRQVLETLGLRTRHHNALGEIAQRRSEAEGELKALQRRRTGIETGMEAVREQTRATAAELEAARQRVGTAEGEEAGLVERRDRLRAELAEAGETARTARARREDALARLEALAAVEEQGEGLPNAVRAVLRQKLRGVDGLLLEGVQVAAPWDRLLENLLGRMQHGVWADRRARTSALGEGEFDLFFPADKPRRAVNLPPARPLRALLSGDEDRCEALCARLGEVFCTDSGEEAALLAVEYPGALFLSKDGEMHGQGFARVGMLAGQAAGVLARRNAMAAATRTAGGAEIAQAAATEAESRARTALEAVEAQLDTLAGDLRDALSARDRAAARHEEASRRNAAAQEELAALEAEEAQLGASLQETVQEEEEAAAARDAAEAERVRLAAALTADEAGAGGAEEQDEAAVAALQESRARHARALQALEHLELRSSETTMLAAQSEQERQQLASELQELRGRVEQLRAEAEAGRTEIRGLLGERVSTDERLAEAAAQCERAAVALATERRRREEEGGRLEEILEQRQEHALSLQRVHMQREELSRGVREEFQQPLDALARSLDIDRAGAHPGPEEHAQQAEELGEVRARLDEIGSVNLEAVKELEEREEREAFMVRERDDLLAARKSLEQTLEELDAQCRARFVETFEKVRGEFENIIRRLFRGGRAEVILTPDMDPLEAGIEIQVRPPGKELRSINLLSGGERTLTALALLLAVFRSRPSPFCLLDEVDAALDDANVERFLDVLVDFKRDTQFIVVTHNRLTMARCERLFGVTMRRRGVSQVVGVELADLVAAARAGDDALAALGVAAQPPPGRDRLAGLVPAAEPEREAEAGG